LINKKGQLKIADLGMSRIYGFEREVMSPGVVTRWYRCPELLYGSRLYTSSIDIWSAGVIFAEMYNRRALWPGDTDMNQLARIVDALGSPTTESWPDCEKLPDYLSFDSTLKGRPMASLVPTASPNAIKLLQDMLQMAPFKRSSAATLLEHAYFTEDK